MPPGRIRRVDGVATLAVFGSMLCWSSTPIWIKYFTGYFDPYTQNLYRYAFALLLWLPYLSVQQVRGRVRWGFWGVALLAALPNIGMQTFWAWSLYYLDAGVMSLLSRQTVIWCALMSIILFSDERRLVRSKRFWIGLLCGLAGAVGVLVFKPGFSLQAATTDASVHRTLIGAAMVTASAFFWGIYAVLVRMTMKGADTRTSFALVALHTTLGCAFIAALAGSPGAVARVPPYVVLMLALSGWICIGLAHVMYYTAIHRIGVAVPTAVLQLVPFAVACMSYLIFGETFTGGQLCSGVVLVVGAALALWAQERLQEPQAAVEADPAGECRS